MSDNQDKKKKGNNDLKFCDNFGCTEGFMWYMQYCQCHTSPFSGSLKNTVVLIIVNFVSENVFY